jgi:hypothetical protein
MALVDGIRLKTGTKVSIKTTPGDDVIAYRGFLLKQVVPADPTIVTEWSPSELEAGVKFTFDAQKAKQELYVFVISAQSAAASTLKVEIVPVPDPYNLKIPKGASMFEWVFTPRPAA